MGHLGAKSARGLLSLEAPAVPVHGDPATALLVLPRTRKPVEHSVGRSVNAEPEASQHRRQGGLQKHKPRPQIQHLQRSGQVQCAVDFGRELGLPVLRLDVGQGAEGVWSHHTGQVEHAVHRAKGLFCALQGSAKLFEATHVRPENPNLSAHLLDLAQSSDSPAHRVVRTVLPNPGVPLRRLGKIVRFQQREPRTELLRQVLSEPEPDPPQTAGDHVHAFFLQKRRNVLSPGQRRLFHVEDPAPSAPDGCGEPGPGRRQQYPRRCGGIHAVRSDIHEADFELRQLLLDHLAEAVGSPAQGLHGLVARHAKHARGADSEARLLPGQYPAERLAQVNQRSVPALEHLRARGTRVPQVNDQVRSLTSLFQRFEQGAVVLTLARPQPEGSL